MFTILAHAGEVHETTTEAAAHSVLTSWYVLLPVFVLMVCGIAALTYVLSRKSKAVTSMVVLVTLFVSGIGLYNTSAVVSVVALTSGFAWALVQVITGLSAPTHKER